MAPLERRGQRLLPRRCGMAPGAQETEPVVEPLRDRRRTERSDPPGRELERERQPVEAKADARDVVRVLVVEREARRRGGCALDEERHGLVLAELVAVRALLRVGNVQRRNAKDDLARHAQRLAARRDDRQPRRGAQQRVDERRRRGQHVLAVVEDEEQRARREEVDHRVDEVLRRQRAHVERGGDGLRDQPRVGERGELDERGARLVRRLGASGELEREPRLPGAARPGKSEEARPPEQRLQLGQLLLPTDERARVGREPERLAEPSAATSSSSSAASAASSSRRVSAQSS